MKIVSDNPPLLTNPEVVHVLKDRQSDPKTAPPASESQVLKSLEARNTVQKSREELQAFQAALAQEFGALTKEDTLQLVNHAPTSILEAFLCLGDAVENERVAEDDLDRIVELVASHLH